MITHNKQSQFTGYLGNRMFQAASTIGIAEANGHEYGFIDNGFMGGFKNFSLKNIADMLGRQFTDIDEGTFNYRKIELNQGNNYNLSGYLQSEKYFKHCEEKIRHTFEFRDNIVEVSAAELDRIRAKHPGRKVVGLHLRLGDYLNLKEHHTCLMETNYYFNAVNLAGVHDSVFVVFNNDANTAENFMQKLKGQLRTLEYEVHHMGPAPHDMCMMSLCDGMIIGNSTMSWWGAWLNKCPDEMKLAPQKELWFGPSYPATMANDILPETWRQVIC